MKDSLDIRLLMVVQEIFRFEEGYKHLLRFEFGHCNVPTRCREFINRKLVLQYKIYIQCNEEEQTNRSRFLSRQDRGSRTDWLSMASLDKPRKEALPQVCIIRAALSRVDIIQRGVWTL